MKKIFLLSALFISAIQLYAQDYWVKIEEDYSKSTSSLFNSGDEFQSNSIENGMYVSKAARMHAQIDFPYSLYDRQRDCIKSSDMEYTIVKVKGDKESFICVQIDPNGDKAYPYLVFQYNELGDWKLTNYLQDKTYASGKAKVNTGVTPNVIKIAHRYSKVSYYVNGELAAELKSDNTLEVRWYSNKVYSQNKKFVLGLDKLFLGGCVTDKEDLAKEQKRKEEEAAKKAAEQPAPPDPNEVIDYNKVYEEQPDTDITWFRDKFEKWGAKNRKGEVLFAPKFSCPVDFYGGVSFMWGEGGAALIDRSGKELTPYRFSDMFDFSEGVALVKSDCDENGEHCKHSYIDKTGKTVLELPAKYLSAGSFSDGLAVVSTLLAGATGETMSDYRFGYIDIAGKEVIPPTFYNAGDFRYNRAPVESSDYKVGYINRAGKVVIPYKYYKLGEMKDYLFSEGLSAVFLKDPKAPDYMWAYNYCYIDVNGKEVIPFKYNGASDFKNGVAVVALNTDKKVNYTYETKKGLVDKTGKELTPLKYDEFGEFIDGLALVSVYQPNSNFVDKAGFIDKTGKEVIPMIYNKASEFSEGLALVEHSCSPDYPYTCKKSFIDKTGKIVFTTPYNVDDAIGFSEGLIVVYECKEIDGESKCKYGFMDKTGKLVSPLKYDFADAFAGGLAIVELNGETFRVDKKGTEIKGGVNPYGEEGDY